MEYVFGTLGNIENLRTKDTVHSNLTGFCNVRRKYPDQTITDNFRIVRKYRSKEDVAGNCYDWYEIDRHYRTIDKTEQLAAQDAQNADGITALENAICELDQKMNGGE